MLVRQVVQVGRHVLREDLDVCGFSVNGVSVVASMLWTFQRADSASLTMARARTTLPSWVTMEF